MKAKAVTFHEFGTPSEVLSLEETDLPAPAKSEALIEILAAPVNPADINFIQGTYGIRPDLPAVPGSEGVGVVIEAGSSVKSLKPGARVLLPHGTGTWRTACLVGADNVVIVPETIPVNQAAMLWVNPPTAYRMLHDFADLQPGDWFIQNAANSGVGTAAIQIAKQNGWKSVNVVRREELISDLKSQGADVVLVDGPDLPKRVREATGGAEIKLALNAVGGENATRCAKCLARSGVFVTYGAMSKQPLNISAGSLIFKDLRYCGFWVTRWYECADKEQVSSMFSEIFPLVANGVLNVAVDSEFALEEFAKASARAMEGGRDGKVLFHPQRIEETLG